MIYKRALSLSKRAIRDGVCEPPQQEEMAGLGRVSQELNRFVRRGERASGYRRKGGLGNAKELAHKGQITRERVLKAASELRAIGKPERGLAGFVARRLGKQGHRITERHVRQILRMQTEASSQTKPAPLSNQFREQPIESAWSKQ